VNHPPTDEQQAIISAAGRSPDSLMISALAGCAKSTTLEMAAPQIRVPALALAFNKKIASELADRLPGNFVTKTMNGLGHGAWLRQLPAGAKLELDDRKLGKLVSQIAHQRKVELSGDQWDGLRQLASKAMQLGIVPAECSKDGAFPGLLPDTEDNWLSAADEVGLLRDDAELLWELAREVVVENIALARKGIISFDDQVYAPTLLGGKFPQFPVVFVDEAQDLSPLNHEMLRLSTRSDGRRGARGAEEQCHPPGTQIMLSGGKTKVIEEIKVGDRLVSYNRKVGFSGIVNQGTSVTDVAVFQFDGNLVRIKTEGDLSHAHDCTPNHRCLVKWTDKQGYALYLMQRGKNFRIGTAQNWYNAPKGGFGPAMRARQEQAEALWILDVYETKEQALIQEKVIWTMFGLPDLIFKCSGRSSSTQEHLDAAWKQIGDNSARAEACLKYFGRERAFPLVQKGDSIHIGDKKMLIEACNVVSGAMSVRVFGGDWSRAWTERVPHRGPVIGLTVESNGFGMHLYVANGIVTHNSIYAFRGADGASLKKIRRLRPNWLDLPLATTFRCPKVVVERQREHAPGFRAWHTNADGRFVRLPAKFERAALDDEPPAEWSFADLQGLLPQARASLAVLCRNNAPLMSLAFKLLRQSVGVVMLGRDIGKGLASLSKKLAPRDETPSDSVRQLVREWITGEASRESANGHPERVASIQDRGECLLAVLDSAEVRDAGQLRLALAKLFAREQGIVTLSSIHRAKGLEWDCVMLLDPWRIPSKWARSAGGVQLQQELNLRYVAETRTKHTLVWADLESFH
jgi:hypothetical protein